jgi:hypothetical protein
MKSDCPICKGLGWVCENHPDKPWDPAIGCQCGGAGVPCDCQGPQDGIDEPDVSEIIKKGPQLKN